MGPEPKGKPGGPVKRDRRAARRPQAGRPGPREAKALGLSRAVPIRPDWDAVKDEVMYQAARAKFETHARARALLLGTGDETIVDNAPDAPWGCGPDGAGLNALGRILMRVRASSEGRRRRHWLASR